MGSAFVGTAAADDGSLDFSTQELKDGAVTVEDVSTDQNSTVVVTYTDESTGEEVVAGLANADNLDDEDVEVTIEDTGGFPGVHTAWVFADEDLPADLGIGDDATPVAGEALDLESARVTAPPSGELTFTDQELEDGAVTVENVSTDQNSVVVVTYTDEEDGEEVIAGAASADHLDGEDVPVKIVDTGGFPGEHTAWVFAVRDLPPGLEIGDDATPIADQALDSESAQVTAPPSGHLSFDDQELEDGAVTVEDVSTDQNSTVVVTYSNESSGEEVVAGLANADTLDDEDVEVTIEDTGGFPGVHTAWVFADEDLPADLGIGDDATPVADQALDRESAQVTDECGTVVSVVTDDGEVSDTALLVVVSHWQHDEPMPGTCGKTVTIGDLFEVADLWRD